MIGRILTIFLLLMGFTTFVYGQYYVGPDSGGVASGAIVSTNNFSKNMTIIEPTEHIWNEETESVDLQNEFIDFGYPTPKEGSNYYEDPNASPEFGRSDPFPFLLQDFEGIPMGNSIPPDPYVAVGPNNIIAVVNTSFRIFDKEGNILKTISADSWFNSVFPNAGAFDPKVLYDVIDQRWIMVWLQQSDGNHTATLLLSVSDDSDPIGTWYNWALPSNLNGTVNSNLWTDYQGVGYDQDAIYITGNQWTFAVGGSYSFQYAKIRIIPKAQLYANTAGSVSWNDLWNINAGNSFTIRPSVMYTAASKYYLIEAPSQGNYFRMWTISDPLTSASLSLAYVSVASYYPAPNASQPGGGISIEGGSSYCRNEPKFRDGFLYVVHSVRNPTYSQYSALHFVKINVASNSADQDFVFGANGYWHFYPAVEVDKDGNVAVTYSRSGTTEYPGAYFTGRLANDPPGFMGSMPVSEGQAHYEVTFGGDRNRWGDYNGVQLDPVNQNNFWVHTEYVKSANTWGTRVGEIRVAPYAGPHLFSQTDSMDFKNVEAGTVSNTLTLGLTNIGTDDVIISDIPSTIGAFHLVTNLTFPYTLSTYDSLYLDFTFNPDVAGTYSEILNITSNYPDFQSILLKGKAYEMNPAVMGKFYAVSGLVNNGSLYILDETTGAGTLIGNSEFDETDQYRSMTINPKTGIIYGLTNIGTESAISRINSSLGDAYILYSLPLQDMYAITCDTTGALYGILKSGDIYKINLNDGTYEFIVTADRLINSAAFDPLTNELWATPFVAVVGEKDAIYTVDLSSGTTTKIGNTGFNILTNDLDFNSAGELYGVKGSSGENNDFFEIDKANGTGTILGSINYPNITGLGFARTGIVGVQEPSDDSKLPKDYTLNQNYPNPFNPSTRIDYTLPVSASVKVTIYNLLGEIVNVLVNTDQNPGSHSVVWNSEDMHGSKVGSGVYFYELKANGTSGRDFTQIRKMILLK